MAAADDASSVALLRGLRSGGAVDSSFVHRVDVCSAAPADLVANLEPVPGTDVADGGYKSVWYFYCPKRYKNVHGKPSGHRQRAIAGGDTCWHSETRPKPVKGLDSATTCNLSFGRKEGSSRSFNRMGWCMTEYDDNQGGGGDHVLCKVYRSSSSLARGKLMASSSSSTKTASSEQTTQSSSGSKRKATADQVQARPTKISHAQASAYHEFCYVGHQVQQQQFCFVGHQEQFDFDPLLCLTEGDQETMPADHQEQLVYDPTLSLADDGQETMPVDDRELFDYDPIMRLLEEDDPEPPNTGAINPRAQIILNELIRICCGPPTAVAPLNAASLSLEALAF